MVFVWWYDVRLEATRRVAARVSCLLCDRPAELLHSFSTAYSTAYAISGYGHGTIYGPANYEMDGELPVVHLFGSFTGNLAIQILIGWLMNC